MMQEPLLVAPADAAPIDFAPDMLVVRDIDVTDPANAGHVSVFKDDGWCLHPASGKPTDRSRASFKNSPEQFKMALKRLVWVALNIGAPLETLGRPTTAARLIKPGTVSSYFKDGWQPFFRWLASRKIKSMDEVDDVVLNAYAEHVAVLDLKPETKRARRRAVTWMWLYAPYLPPEDRIGIPPWEAADAESAVMDRSGAEEPQIENATDPIHPQTMSGLLVWSIGLVDCSDDILQAVDRRTAMTASVRHRSQPGDLERWAQYLDSLRQSGEALPGQVLIGGRTGIAAEYLSATLDISTAIIKNRKPGDIPIRVGAPLDIAIEGRIGGEPWVDAIGFYEVDAWVRRLATACLVVIDYLAGMRPDECLSLRHDCSHQSDPGDALSGFEIRGKIFKGKRLSRTDRGDQGRAHTWYVIEPVAKAVEVMKRLHRALAASAARSARPWPRGRPDAHDLLFSVAAFGTDTRRARDRSLNTTRANASIRKLIEWCNSVAGGPGRPIIPPDPKGEVTIMRFRRTIAWFVYRLPHGLIALGHQYGHINLTTTARYGNHIRSGLSEVMEEHAFALRDHLEHAAERLNAGEGVSGPASERYAGGITEYRETFKGRVLTRSGAKDFLANPSFRIYDNSAQFVACCYDATQALCHPDNDRMVGIERTPDLTRCDPACPNITRTDTHMDGIHKKLREMDDEVGSPATPEPWRVRLTQRRAKMQAILDAHERNRVVPSRQAL